MINTIFMCGSPCTGETYHFLTGTDYVVGRKNCAILIQDDQSISRSHATLSVSHSASDLGQPDIIPVLTIKDGSKYGTFINGEKMENSSLRNIKSGDKVTFGVFNSKYRVEYEPLIACSSCLQGSEKTSLNQAILHLGGHVVNNWTEKCTHLVMNSIKVTIKTICALICCRPIVKPEYLTELMKAIQQKQTLPVSASFIPSIDEPSIKSDLLDLSENAKRTTIFKEKIFFFLNAKQYRKLSPAIIFGGGKAKLVTGEMKDTSLLENPATCVIDVGVAESQLSESSQTWISSTLDFLHSKDLRAIPEAEIGLAVIYMSTEIYCNPQRSPGSGNESESSNRDIILGPTLSQSMAVDETILPATTLNITAYVANTEPQDQTNAWMDAGGVYEVKETPKMDGKGKYSSSNASVKNDVPSTGSSMSSNVKAALFQKEDITGAEKKKPQFPSLDMSARNKEKSSQPQQPSTKINHYFQPVTKKRDRDEDGKEMSSKLARIENLPSLFSEQSQPIMPSLPKGKCSQKTRKYASDVGMEPGPLSSEKSKLSSSNAGDNTVAVKTILAEDPTPKKRKEPDDLVAEESDFESQEDINVKMDHNGQKGNLNILKKRRLDSEKDAHGDTNIKLDEEIKSTSKQLPPQTIHTIKTELEIKKEPVSQSEQSKTSADPQEECDGLPSKLLLTEFRSLLVSRPAARHSQFTAKTNLGDAVNFKKFRKIAYPGVGGFPNIIGGSDLIAHDRRKNSELEQWLRQEMEGQSQQAREDSLAEDLFRYNPKSVKRRR
ncbi:nibrin isoform X2 [Ascaphus truei]|uniref:nibrin isoform X2 n=1 Tax=Ascaphus truei TaxID=8439 RepID=UPI003F5AA989